MKEALLKTGFKNWSKTDFGNFLIGSEKYGRDNISDISKHVSKSYDEVKEYHQVFWERID